MQVSLWNGDITTLEIDAIVRGTDTTLREKLGPHASVHKSAGPTLMKVIFPIYLTGPNLRSATLRRHGLLATPILLRMSMKWAKKVGDPRFFFNFISGY